MSIIGRWFAIESFKHDGSIHRLWDRGLVLDNNPDFIVVATKRAKVIESNGRRWYTKEPAVTIFSKKEWWNTICMFKQEGITYYCNIASPAVVDNGVIKYIDYDLDAKLFVNKEIKVLDEKEYIHHKKKYAYSDDLDKILHYQTEQVLKMMKEEKFPFDNKQIQEYFDKFLGMIKKDGK